MFPAFPERDNDCLPPGHSALKTDDFPKLVSHSADDAGRPHAYYQQASTVSYYSLNMMLIVLIHSLSLSLCPPLIQGL